MTASRSGCLPATPRPLGPLSVMPSSRSWVSDFDDTATLRTAFTGSDKAFMSYGKSDRQVRDEIALIDAAIGADVPYLVNLSVAGAGGTNPADVLQWHTEIDAYLATTGVASTVLRPTTFTDTMLKLAANYVPSG